MLNQYDINKVPALAIKVIELPNVVLFVVRGSIKKLLIDFVNIYVFSITFSIDFARWKSVGLPHIPCFINFKLIF